ncbi:hypothetical protein [Pseudolactococcus hodotermopsidis]|uniref:hypothetical protein n=1 Tax=Pseudolactococcus hodotermopsidis TaxID=2709157 RepID=UPI001556E5B0|nr:hypothetical protein [Lactococcus hodotermopsidis]
MNNELTTFNPENAGNLPMTARLNSKNKVDKKSNKLCLPNCTKMGGRISRKMC